jgi:hypothetical protein
MSNNTKRIWTWRGKPVDDIHGEDDLREALMSALRQMERDKLMRDQDARMRELFERFVRLPA